MREVTDLHWVEIYVALEPWQHSYLIALGIGGPDTLTPFHLPLCDHIAHYIRMLLRCGLLPGIARKVKAKGGP